MKLYRYQEMKLPDQGNTDRMILMPTKPNLVINFMRPPTKTKTMSMKIASLIRCWATRAAILLMLKKVGG